MSGDYHSVIWIPVKKKAQDSKPVSRETGVQEKIYQEHDILLSCLA